MRDSPIISEVQVVQGGWQLIKAALLFSVNFPFALAAPSLDGM